MTYKVLLDRHATRTTGLPPPKFAIRSILVRRTRSEQQAAASLRGAQRRSNPVFALAVWIASLRSQ
jgi:hypothetical protein